MNSIVDKDINQLFIDKFADFEEQLNGQKELSVHQLRKEALQKFKAVGLPNKHEEYKYTNLKKALKSNFNLSNPFAESNLEINKDDLIKGLEGNILVFVNGHFSPSISNFNTDEVEIKQLKKAYSENKGTIDKYFGALTKENPDSFARLNSMYSNDGVFVEVKKKKQSTTPVIIYYVSDARTNEAVSFPRNLFIAEEGSKSNFIEVYNTIGEHKSFSNAVTEIAIGKNGILNYYKLANDTEQAYHVGLTTVSQQRDSVLNAHSYSFGGGIIRNNLQIAIEDENCTSNMYGLYLLNGKSHVDNHTEVDHKKPNSYSNELYKGILDENATGVFNGKIFVRQDAQKTNAFQSNKNILLTDTATVNTKPQLEIWADDVKCSHGCTTGQLDEEALFYLRARGIGKNKAKAMLFYAFAIDILENVTIEPLKIYLDSIIAKRFQQEEI